MAKRGVIFQHISQWLAIFKGKIESKAKSMPLLTQQTSSNRVTKTPQKKERERKLIASTPSSVQSHNSVKVAIMWERKIPTIETTVGKDITTKASPIYISPD